MEFLPGMYSNAEHGSALHLSTLAVGFFSLAAWTGQASLFRASERTFLKALPKIRNALQSSDSTDLDSMLVSILLLSIYEVRPSSELMPPSRIDYYIGNGRYEGF